MHAKRKFLSSGEGNCTSFPCVPFPYPGIRDWEPQYSDVVYTWGKNKKQKPCLFRQILMQVIGEKKKSEEINGTFFTLIGGFPSTLPKIGCLKSHEPYSL